MKKSLKFIAMATLVMLCACAKKETVAETKIETKPVVKVAKVGSRSRSISPRSRPCSTRQARCRALLAPS